MVGGRSSSAPTGDELRDRRRPVSDSRLIGVAKNVCDLIKQVEVSARLSPSPGPRVVVVREVCWQMAGNGNAWSRVDLLPSARQPRVREEPGEWPYNPTKESVNRRDEGREPKPPQHPPQPPSRRDVLEQTDTRRTVHQPDSGRLDKLPRFRDLVLRDAGGVGRSRLVVPAQQRQSLLAIQSGDEPRRSAAERTATVKHQKRPARRWNIPEPRALDYEAIHGSTQRTWTNGIPNEGSGECRNWIVALS
jgi:hypothetical protein